MTGEKAVSFIFDEDMTWQVVKGLDLEEIRYQVSRGGRTIVPEARSETREIRFRNAALRNLISRVLGPRPWDEGHRPAG